MRAALLLKSIDARRPEPRRAAQMRVPYRPAHGLEEPEAPGEEMKASDFAASKHLAAAEKSGIRPLI